LTEKISAAFSMIIVRLSSEDNRLFGIIASSFPASDPVEQNQTESGDLLNPVSRKE
jgi:hypothetical protein